MLRIFVAALVVVVIILVARNIFDSEGNVKSSLIPGNNSSPTEISEELLFVPYWTLASNSDISNYDTLIYFGVAADENGLITDPGSESVDEFLQLTNPSQKKLLALRLVDHDKNMDILDNKNIQEKIINETIAFAKENSFDGIVIDFETKSLGFEEITDTTTNFLVQSVENIKQNDLEAHTLLFGDNYYRARAFDVKKIADTSDSIMIMTYDFHKSGGNPGPTFPTYGKEKYGYDLSELINDFENDAPKDKTVIILGMFGYNWEVDQEGNSKRPATAVTLGEAEMNFLNNCQEIDCTIKIDEKSQEANIKYKDSERNLHEVWVETEDSSRKKIQLLEEKGISKVGYWANSFF